MQQRVAGNRLTFMADEKEIFDITSAPKALSADQASRQKRYFISMMIRTACFILTVILPSPYRWVALLGAVALPYFAVVIANAGRETFVRGVNVQDENPRSLS
jgi:Flp pilus assembly protein TadB